MMSSSSILHLDPAIEHNGGDGLRRLGGNHGECRQSERRSDRCLHFREDVGVYLVASCDNEGRCASGLIVWRSCAYRNPSGPEKTCPSSSAAALRGLSNIVNVRC